jgi:hypothetical protein
MCNKEGKYFHLNTTKTDLCSLLIKGKSILKIPSENLDIKKTFPLEGLEGTAINECNDVLCHRNI